MPLEEPQSGEIKYFFDFQHINGTNIQAMSTITPNTEELMDEAWQDFRDLLAGWDKRDPNAGFYSQKQAQVVQNITTTPPAEE